MKIVVLIICSCLLFNSCQKKIEYDSSVDSELFVNAEFIDCLTTQSVTVYRSIPIEIQSTFNPINDATVEVIQNNQTYQFTSNNSGTYFSDVAFMLNSGEPFTVKYKIDTAALSETYTTPFPIQIDSLYAPSDGFFRDIAVSLKSQVKQYFLYKVYQEVVQENFEDSILLPSFDTVWVENSGEAIFQILEVNAGQNNIMLPVNDRYNATDDSTKVKAVLTVISKQTRDYFIILNDYFETIATSSLYVNPPRFYSNQFYGVTYAFSKDSVTITL